MVENVMMGRSRAGCEAPALQMSLQLPMMMRIRRMVLIILIVVCWSCRLLELYESIVSCLQKRFEDDGDNRLGM